MSDGYTNKHGRTFTRGLRPYLLIPKVLCVAGYFGGLLAMLLVDNAQRLHVWLVIPAAVGALALGVALLALQGTIMLRMRWLQVKLMLVILVIVGGHLAYETTGSTLINAALLGNAAVLIWLGRHKPRLGQNIATVYQQRKVKEQLL